MKMASTSKNKGIKAKKIWIPLLAILVIGLSGLGYYYWQQSSQTQDTSSSTVNTTQVRQGSITISVSGSGTLAASQESNLSFSAAGTVAKVNVQIGDKVKKGDDLAELLNITALEDNVKSAEQVLISAQQDLATLKQNAAYNIANAQLAVVTAQKAVTDSKSDVVQVGCVGDGVNAAGLADRLHQDGDLLEINVLLGARDVVHHDQVDGLTVGRAVIDPR